MADLNRLDKATLYKLTNSIEKAASMAMATDKDRSELLAEQLDKDDIPKHLTKLAATAFNRRLAVVTLGKRNDDTKAEDFPIANIEKVASLRGCEEGELTKSASYAPAAFKFVYTPNQMKKEASAKVLEKVDTVKDLLKKMLHLLDTETINFQKLVNDLDYEQRELDRMVKKSAAVLNKDTKTARLLSTVYGDTYTNLFKGKVEDSALEKYAAYAVLPKTAEVELVLNTIKQADLVEAKQKLFSAKREELNKVASDVAYAYDYIHKGIISGMIKQEAAGYSVTKDIMANIASAPVMGLLNAGMGAINQGESLAKQFGDLKPEFGYSPSEVLSLSLLNSDNYEDKRQRLIDMLAQDDFKSYKAREIEKAVEDSINDNKAFAQERNRGYLKTDVASRLLANNRTNKADQSATAELVKRLAEATKIYNENSAEAAVGKLGETTGGEKKLKDIIPGVSLTIDNARAKAIALTGTNLDILGKQLNSDLEKLKAENKDEAKAEADLQNKIKGENIKNIGNYMKLRQKLLQQMAEQNALAGNYTLANGKHGTKAKFNTLSADQKAQVIQRAQQYIENPANAQKVQDLLAAISTGSK